MKEGKMASVARLAAIGVISIGFAGSDNLSRDSKRSVPYPPSSFERQEQPGNIFEGFIENKVEIPRWRDNDVPKSIIIPSINFHSDSIRLAKIIKDPKSDKNVPEVPEDGIATLEAPIKNNLYIFGHSRWNDNMKEFAKVAKIERGDVVIISNQNNKIFSFEISNFQLVNIEDDMYSLYPEQPTLTLQTSVRSNGKWIYDRETLLRIFEKTGIDENSLQQAGDLVLIITGQQIN